jgi:hypothetical protein
MPDSTASNGNKENVAPCHFRSSFSTRYGIGCNQTGQTFVIGSVVYRCWRCFVDVARELVIYKLVPSRNMIN